MSLSFIGENVLRPYLTVNAGFILLLAISAVYLLHQANVVYGAPFASKHFITEQRGLPLIRIRDLATHEPGVCTEEKHPKGHIIERMADQGFDGLVFRMLAPEHIKRPVEAFENCLRRIDQRPVQIEQDRHAAASGALLGRKWLKTE